MTEEETLDGWIPVACTLGSCCRWYSMLVSSAFIIEIRTLIKSQKQKIEMKDERRYPQKTNYFSLEISWKRLFIRIEMKESQLLEFQILNGNRRQETRRQKQRQVQRKEIYNGKRSPSGHRVETASGRYESLVGIGNKGKKPILAHRRSLVTDVWFTVMSFDGWVVMSLVFSEAIS